MSANSTSLDKTFHVSLILKAADSLLEILGGLLALFISPAAMNHIATALTQHELSNDPHDYFAVHFLKAAHDFANSGRYFAAFYLLSHGLVKLVIIVGLFKDKLWAYPSMILVLGGFIIYQIYRLSYKFSWWLVLLTLFDVFIILLTWLEYKKHASSAKAQT